LPKITYIHPDGERTELEAAEGASVMETAVAAGIEEIVAECGGNQMCATCHVYVAEDWFERLPAPEDDEREMLDETAAPRERTSRLSCQLVATSDLDGLVVRLPDTQG
jgi:2Fe-2S ferredoxin